MRYCIIYLTKELGIFMIYTGELPSHNVLYKGSSMNPTFFTDDLLYYEPVGIDKINKWDVIVFRSPIIQPIIIHRVVGVRDGGLLTQGDNNFNLDPFILSPEQIMGRVVAGKRAGKVFAVKSGTAGCFMHYYALFYRFLLLVFRPVLKIFYDKLSESKILFRFGKDWINPRLVAIQTKEGTDFHLFFGNRLIAWKQTGHRNWYIRPPYRLFIEPESFLQMYDTSFCSHYEDNDK